jgi:3-isopropylmalate dehydrogenase
MRLVQWPNSYDVLITENLFGDILTDEASVISGSMGLMPSASLGEENALFEPIHGSYPQATGLNIANPMATILSAAMLFENFGLHQEGKAIRVAVNSALEEGVVTEDLADGGKAFGTKEVGDWLAENI